MSLKKEIGAVVVGGIAGALAMTALRAVLVESGTVSEPLPHKVERRMTTQIGVAHTINARQEDLLAQGLHLAMGAAFGAGYGLYHRWFGLPPAVGGPLYGLAVYAVNLVGLGPAFELTRPPWRKQPLMTGRQILNHLVYGYVTAFVFRSVHS